MCGIAGYTHLEKEFSPNRIQYVTNTLTHRGPDQIGTWQSETASLGATRLQVIDKKSGRQPMASEDNDYVIVFNGEIYNHKEVREALLRYGHSFHTSCDTEVVLRAFMQWDVDCIKRFRGMFAFAVWQESRRRLVLARDRVGIKPLYYLCQGRDIYFGSEIKAIFSHPEIDRTIDLEALDAYLGMNYVPGPRTLAAKVMKLSPGHILIWQKGSISTDCYWRVRRDMASSASLPELTARLDDLLSNAVKDHLISDVPTGVWLSGGIDSSTVLHYAAQNSSTPVKTFSITFNGREFDEARYIRETAAFYGTTHVEMDLNPETASADSVTQLAYYADEPNADAGAVPVWHLSKLSSRSITVALSGEGADELFGGYITYQADRYAQVARLLPRSVLRLGLRGATRLKASDKKIGVEYKLQRFLQGALLEGPEAHIFWNGTFSREQRGRLVNYSSDPYLERILSAISPFGGIKRFMNFDQDYYLPDNILAKVDRMSMAHALEVRPPFLDHRIVEFAAKLPAHLCIRGRTLKILLRELVRQKLPSSVLSKRKCGLDIPVHAWLRGHMKPLLMDTLTREAVEESGLFSWPEIEFLLNCHMKKQANYGYHLWGLLMLFLWIKRWGIRCNTIIPAEKEEYAPEYA